MAILIPEKVIKEELDILIKLVHNDLVSKRALFAVNTAIDVDASVFISVLQIASLNQPEKTEITFPIGANIGGTSWNISSPSVDYYVWYDIGGSIDPSTPLRKPIKVNVLTLDTADLIAVKTKAAIESIKNEGADVFFVNISTLPSKIIVTNVEVNAERTSLLWGMFGGLAFDKFSYFYQMGKILSNTFGSEARKLTISLGWTQKREGFPHVSILLPSEEDAPKNVGIIQGSYDYNNGTGSKEKELSYISTYSLFITSDNQNDVIVLYHFLKTIILMGYEQFSCSGLQNLYLSGRDITMDFDLDPMNLYHRTVAMQFHYENTIPSIQTILNPTMSSNFTPN